MPNEVENQDGSGGPEVISLPTNLDNMKAITVKNALKRVQFADQAEANHVILCFEDILRLAAKKE